MRDHRMFSKEICESDAFMSLSDGAKVLYFYLCMNSDDDGFCNAPRRIMNQCGAKDDDMKLLTAKKFVIIFDEYGVAVIKHWRIHNYITKDKYKATKYKEIFSELYIDSNKSYSLTPQTSLPETGTTTGTYAGTTTGTQSKDKEREEKISKENISQDKSREGGTGGEMLESQPREDKRKEWEDVIIKCIVRGDRTGAEQYAAMAERCHHLHFDVAAMCGD